MNFYSNSCEANFQRLITKAAIMFKVDCDNPTYYNTGTKNRTYLFVSGPMKGLVISCTVALEANSNPTLTFSLTSMLGDRGQLEEFCGSAVAVGAVGSRSVDLAVALELKDLTVLSYKDTML